MTSIGEVVEQFDDIASKHIKFSNDIQKLREEGELTLDNTSSIQASYQKFKEAVDSFQVPKLKRRLNTDAGSSTSKRIRKQSGVVSLKELRESLKLEDISDPSVKELQRQGSAIEKLQLLYCWEKSAARSIVRVSFHSGYIINKFLFFLELKDLAKQSNIGIYTLKRNRQLFQQLRQFRTILYATVPISRLHKSITSIKKELDALSPEERDYWINPPREYINDPAGFVKVCMDWFNDQPPTRVFYELDLFDNKLNSGVDDILLAEICTLVAKVEDHHQLSTIEFWKPFKDRRYVLAYWTHKYANGHATIINRNENGTYETYDDVTIADMCLETPWYCAKLLTFK